MSNSYRWIETMLRRRLSSIPPDQHTRRRLPTRLVLEPLEDRTVPAAVTVTNLNDLVNGTTTSISALIANSGGDGISLREAILASNNPDEDDTITFQAGLAGTLTLTGGQMEITDPVTITGNGAANTILDANQMSRIFLVSNAAGDVSLEKLALVNGQTTASNDGGGAVRFLSAGRLTVSHCSLSGNSTAGTLAGGGAIFAGIGAVTVSHSTLSGNSTAGLTGDGGALSAGGELTVSHSTLSGNSTAADGARGGAVASSNGPLTVSHSTLSGNSTVGTSARGGAIFVNSGAVTVSNSTLSGNSTAGPGASGGAIWTSFGAVTVSNSTVAFNRTPQSGGGGIISFSAPVTVTNSIVAKNTSDGNAPDILPSSDSINDPLTVRHSLIGDNNGTGLAAAPLPTPDANGNFIGTAASPIDPLLGPLAANDGPTLTHAPLPGSPVIDRGDNALALDPLNNPLVNDQRGAGFARFIGLVDMGAFEAPALPQSPPPPPPGPSVPVVTIQVKKAKRVTRVIILKDGAVHKTIYPFGKRFTGKVKVLPGDYNGDGLLDVLASAKINGKKKTRTFLTT